MSELEKLAASAKRAAEVLACAGTDQKNRALYLIAKKLEDRVPDILFANEEDLSEAEKNGIPPVMLDRLRLTEERVRSCAAAVREIARMEDPIGEVMAGFTRPNGMEVKKVRTPLGVVGIIYESRPNVTVDAAALCLKAGNAAFLRGGKEAIRSNIQLGELMREALQESGLPQDAIVVLEDTSRETATELMRLNGLIDVLIPRGSSRLIQSVIQNATLPVIETGIGNCHVVIDSSANLRKATEIVYNAKTSRPSVCNAAESLVVLDAVAELALPMIKKRLDEKNVQLYGCPRTIEILGDAVLPATEEDYGAEYLDYKMSVVVVDSFEEAIRHVQRYSSGHSECVVTETLQNARLFTQRVDAAAVYVNVSTRFTDGAEFGQGAEIGISTQKLHTRGPMGLKELTSMKYIVYGNGQIR